MKTKYVLITVVEEKAKYFIGKEIDEKTAISEFIKDAKVFDDKKSAKIASKEARAELGVVPYNIF